jgi:hypothetical protein
LEIQDGGIHLNKGLLIIDAYYYSLFKKTLTGIGYVKDRPGPVPEGAARSVINAMNSSKVKVQQEQKGPWHTRDSHYAIAAPDVSGLSREAIDIIKEVAAMIKPISAKKLSKLTHNEVWKNTKTGGIIPIDSAYTIKVLDHSIRELTEEEEKETSDILEEMYAKNELGIREIRT